MTKDGVGLLLIIHGTCVLRLYKVPGSLCAVCDV